MMRFPLNDDREEEIEDLQTQLDLMQSLMEMIADGKVLVSRGEDGEVLFQSTDKEQNFDGINFNN